MLRVYLTHTCLCPGRFLCHPHHPSFIVTELSSGRREQEILWSLFMVELAAIFPAIVSLPTLGGTIASDFFPHQSRVPLTSPQIWVEVAAPPCWTVLFFLVWLPPYMPIYRSMCQPSRMQGSEELGGSQPLPGGHFVGLFPIAHFFVATYQFSVSQ